MARAVVAALAAIAWTVGCSSPAIPARRPASPPPPPAVAPPDTTAFRAAVDAYDAEVRRVQGMPSVEARELGPAVHLLGAALNLEPHGAATLSAPLTVSVLESLTSTTDLLDAAGVHLDPTPTFKHVLELVTASSLELAYGPYQSDPDVLARVQDLDEAVRRVDDGAAGGDDGGSLLRALSRAALLLRAMDEATSRRYAAASINRFAARSGPTEPGSAR